MRKRQWSKRELTNAVLYLVDSGCKWRQSPHDFPPYSTVHSFYRRARLSGLWDRIMKQLVIISRKNAGRNEEPTYAIIDSQSVKTAGSGEDRGFDGEKTKGRKRHIVTDTMGNILGVVIHAANIHDAVSGIEAAKEAFQNWPTIMKFCGDSGYRGTFVHEVNEKLLMSVEISEKSKAHEWEILPRRWIVERTFTWLNHSRRLSKDYEVTTSSALAMLQISHLHTLLTSKLLSPLHP